MANSSVAEERWDLSQQDQEEEALSLCDLPTNLIQEDSDNNQETRTDYQETETHQEDFNFNSPWGGNGIGGSVSPKSEMCAADDIFFQGQILPLRHSVSSEPGLIRKFRNDIISLKQSSSVSRSESMDRNSVSGFASFSSRSSSSNCSRSSTSHFSSSTTTTTKTARVSKPRSNSIPKNQFLYSNHPSPKPQIRLSSASWGSSSSNRNRNSSVWEFFRVGLVRTPGIELQDIMARNSVSRNSSSSSSNSDSNFKNSIKPHQEQSSNPVKEKQSSSERKAGLLLSGCSCSVNAVKPIPSENFVVKIRKSTTSDVGNDGKFDELMKNKKKRIMVAKKQSTKQQQQQQQGKGGKGKEKHATSRHRTFEWIKELSHSHVDDED